LIDRRSVRAKGAKRTLNLSVAQTSNCDSTQPITD